MNDVWLTCSHIPGNVNYLMDAMSRKFNDRHEWKLDENIFNELCEIFGVPSIDLFTSRLTNSCLIFVHRNQTQRLNTLMLFLYAGYSLH